MIEKWDSNLKLEWWSLRAFVKLELKEQINGQTLEFLETENISMFKAKNCQPYGILFFIVRIRKEFWIIKAECLRLHGRACMASRPIVQCWHSQGVHSVTQQPQPQHGSACVGLYSNIRQEHSECKYKLYKQQKIRKLLLQNWVWNPLIQNANMVSKTFHI